jgi:hypothetical protein
MLPQNHISLLHHGMHPSLMPPQSFMCARVLLNESMLSCSSPHRWARWLHAAAPSDSVALDVTPSLTSIAPNVTLDQNRVDGGAGEPLPPFLALYRDASLRRDPCRPLAGHLLLHAQIPSHPHRTGPPKQPR